MSSIPRILVVDDDPINRKFLADLLERGNHEVVTAAGGAEALEIIGCEPVDLVLLDLMMPRVDGMAVLAELGRRGVLPNLPVVVVTSHDAREVRIEALGAGAIDFLAKPIDRVELMAKVAILVEIKQLRDRALAEIEGQLRESDHLLRLRFEQSPVAEITWDSELQVTGWNAAAERLFGYSRGEAVGKHASFLSPALGEQGYSVWASLESGATRATTRENIARDGRTLICEWHDAPLTSADGTLVGASSVALDVTERRRLEDALVQAQKMDALGQLAGGIAHDFNNILAVIMSYGTLIRETLPEGDERLDDIVEVLKAGDRAARLTRQLLAFSRQQPRSRQPTDLNQSLTQLHKLLARTLGEHIDLSVVPSARPAVVEIDPVQFDQIALNLTVNARDAMPDGGRLRVALAHAPETGDGPGWVVLEVTDSGAGIDEETQRRIFEPFFTTKERGTGMGLATCFGIVADAGGTIAVDSAPGRGSTFTVKLPLSSGSTDPDGPPERIRRAGRGENVLLVEDDDAVRRVGVRVLESAGYSVHTAVDGDDAIEKIDALGADLDVLVTDVVMPGRNGYDVAAHAERVAPDAAVLMTSGYLDRTMRQAHFEDRAILWKPVSPRDLVRAVSEAVKARPARPAVTRAAAPAPRSNPGPTPSAAPAPPGPRRDRVLIVDDDRAVAKVSVRALATAGIDAVVAGSLAEARTALADEELDALILDLGLPDGSGLELLGELRGHKFELPVVMMTGALSVEAAEQAIRSRVSDYLPKPFAPGDLVAMVEAALESGRVARLRTKLLASRYGGDEFLRNLADTERSFKRALSRIRMAFQPIVRAADGSVFGYEALLRCDEPSLASPMRLLAAAEVLGRVDEVGRTVRASVAATMAEHRDRLDAIFVNLHPTELRADLLEADPLRSLAGRVVLEVTERASLDAGERLDEELVRIRDLGYRVALDDLGEGYAGLSSLVHLCPDITKLDMSLVRGIHQAPLKRDIVAALVDMARRSAIVVVAEGIETVEERDTLIDLGCDLLQGYLFAKPGPPFPTPRTSF